MISLDAAPLHAALALLKGATGSAQHIEILSHVLIRPSNEHVELIATNMDFAVTLTLPLEQMAMEETEPFTCAPLTLQALVNPQITHPVMFMCDDGTLKVTQNGMSATLPTLDSEAFPCLEQPDVEGIEVSSELLQSALNFVMGAASKEEVRFYLKGVFFEPDPDKGITTLVATNGHILRAIVLDGLLTDTSLIVPLEAIPHILALLKKAETITLKSNDTRLSIVTTDHTFTTKLVDGTYPDWRRVAPKRPTAPICTIDARELATAASRTLALTSKGRLGVKISSSDNPDKINMLLSGENGRISIDVNAINTQAFESFGLNPGYLSETLRALSTYGVSEVDIYHTSNITLIDPSGASAPSTTAIIMGMKV